MYCASELVHLGNREYRPFGGGLLACSFHPAWIPPDQPVVYCGVQDRLEQSVCLRCCYVADLSRDKASAPAPNISLGDRAELLVYVSATAPPFAAAISGQTWEPQGLTSR